jgi:hypothetical protein
MAAESDEYARLLALFQSEDDDASDSELLSSARRLAELKPDSVESWLPLANITDWMLRERRGTALRDDPLFPEMLAAYDKVIALDGTDSAEPYNKACMLARAGLLDDAYEGFMLAGRTEMAHPGDIDWPAGWHFEHAARVALEADDDERASRAAEAAFDSGDFEDASAESMLSRLRLEAEQERHTEQAHGADASKESLD